MKPTRVEYQVGETIYEQPLTLTAYIHNGQKAWILERSPANQRDNSAEIAGLTDEAILKMAEAVKESRGH